MPRVFTFFAYSACVLKYLHIHIRHTYANKILFPERSHYTNKIINIQVENYIPKSFTSLYYAASDVMAMRGASVLLLISQYIETISILMNNLLRIDSISIFYIYLTIRGGHNNASKKYSVNILFSSIF